MGNGRESTEEEQEEIDEERRIRQSKFNSWNHGDERFVHIFDGFDEMRLPEYEIHRLRLFDFDGFDFHVKSPVYPQDEDCVRELSICGVNPFMIQQMEICTITKGLRMLKLRHCIFAVLLVGLCLSACSPSTPIAPPPSATASPLPPRTAT